MSRQPLLAAPPRARDGVLASEPLVRVRSPQGELIASGDGRAVVNGARRRREGAVVSASVAA